MTSPADIRATEELSGVRRTPHERHTKIARTGQAAVELALVLPILITIVFGVIEFGNAFWAYQQVSAATSEGARTAALSRASATRTNDVVTSVDNAAPGLSQSQLSVTTTSTWVPGSTVTVATAYQLNSIGIGLLHTMGFSGTLHVSRTARVEQ